MPSHKNYIIGKQEAELQRSYSGGSIVADAFLAFMILAIMYIVYQIYTTYTTKSYVDSKIISIKKILINELNKIKESKSKLISNFKTDLEVVRNEVDKQNNPKLKNIVVKFDNLTSQYYDKLEQINNDLNINNKESAMSNIIDDYQNKSNNISTQVENLDLSDDIKVYKKKYENLLLSYKIKNNELNDKYSTIVNLDEQRNSKINNIIKTLENRIQLLEQKKQTNGQSIITQKQNIEQKLENNQIYLKDIKNKYEQYIKDYEIKIKSLNDQYEKFISKNKSNDATMQAIIDKFKKQEEYLNIKRQEYDNIFAENIKKAQNIINLNISEIESLKLDYQKLISGYDTAVANAANAASKDTDKTNLGVLEKLLISGNVTIGKQDRAIGSKILLYGGHNKGASINFLDPYGDSGVYITGHNGTFLVNKGSLEVDRDALINGNLKVNSGIEVNQIKLNNKLNDQNYLEPGLISISGVDADYPGAIQFTDRDGNPLIYISGRPDGLHINNNLETGGYITLAAYNETPAQLVFKDNKGNTKTSIQLDSDNLIVQNGLTINKKTNLMGDVDINGNLTILKNLNGNKINAKFLTLDDDLTVNGNTIIKKSLLVTDSITGNNKTYLKNGLEIIGTVDIKPDGKLPGTILLKGSVNDSSYIQFVDNNGKEISKLEATQNGIKITNKNLTIDNFAIVKKGIKALKGLEVGTPGEKNEYSSPLTLYGGVDSNFIQFRTNQTNSNGEYIRQAYIQGVGKQAGGIAVRGGPLYVDENLQVSGKSLLKGDTNITGYMKATGNIYGIDFIASGDITVNKINSKNNIKSDNDIISANMYAHHKITGSNIEGKHGLYAGQIGSVDENSKIPRGILHINSNATEYGSILFNNKSRINKGEITVDDDNMIINNTNLKVNKDINTKNLTASNSITGNYIKSNGDIIATGNLQGNYIKSLGNLDANGYMKTTGHIEGQTIKSKGNLIADGESYLEKVYANNGLQVKTPGDNIDISPYIDFYHGNNKRGTIYITDNNTVISKRINSQGGLHSDVDIYSKGEIKSDSNIYSNESIHARNILKVGGDGNSHILKANDNKWLESSSRFYSPNEIRSNTKIRSDDKIEAGGNITSDGIINASSAMKINNVNLTPYDRGLVIEKENGDNNTLVKFGEWANPHSVGYIKWKDTKQLETNSKINVGGDVTIHHKLNANKIFSVNDDNITIKKDDGYIQFRNNNNKRYGYIQGNNKYIKIVGEMDGIRMYGKTVAEDKLYTNDKLIARKGINFETNHKKRRTYKKVDWSRDNTTDTFCPEKTYMCGLTVDSSGNDGKARGIQCCPFSN